MIASWQPLKRHSFLFRILKNTNLKEVRVALVGYAWAGSSRKDIEREAYKYGVLKQITFFESIPHAQVASILNQSKVAVMLTEREGANRGIYEAFCCNVPVILYRYNRGVNKDIINDKTGMLADDNELGEAISYMLSHYTNYSPREWLMANSGYLNAWTKLNNAFLEIERIRTGKAVSDLCMIKSNPNLVYVNDADRLRMETEYCKLKSFLSPHLT